MLWDDGEFKMCMWNLCNRGWQVTVSETCKIEQSLKKNLWFVNKEQHEGWKQYDKEQQHKIERQLKIEQHYKIDVYFGREELLQLEEQFIVDMLYDMEELRNVDGFYISLVKKRVFIFSGFIFYCAPKLLTLNYVIYLFYKQKWLTYLKGNAPLKLRITQYKSKLQRVHNYLYYSNRLRMDDKFKRSVVQLTPKYRNKFFTFFKKNLHFNLSVGRVFFWKLKKTVFGRILNFYNVFFRCVIPFLSKKFTFLLYKLFSGWSGDFQKFGVSIARARKRRKIRRKFSFFKIIILPKLIYGFMRTAKYPIRKRFLQRRSFIKYMCS